MTPRTSQADFLCETCNLPFQRREHYQRHLRTHTKEKPFSCSECGQSFGRVDSLARHHTALHLSADRQENRDRQNDRRRVSQACKPCSASKVRCDGERPCQRCRRQDNECYYEPSAKRKMSEAGSDKTIAKRYRNNNTNSNAATSIATHSPLSPPATVHDNSYEITQSDMHVSPIQAQYAEPPKVDDLTIEVQPIDPLLEMPTSSAPEYPVNTMAQPEMHFGGNDMFLDFDPTKNMPTPSLLFGDAFEPTSWLNYGTEQEFTPFFLQNEPSIDAINELWLDQAGLRMQQPTVLANPTPTSMIDQSAVAELYSRSHSPALDRDAVEPRQYHPVNIEVDAQLSFPDLSHLTAEEIDQENLAHVEEVPEEVSKKAAQAALEMQNSASYPRFRHIAIPPAPVLNAWVQLYFEFFHPVLPILHKSTFSASKRHWLLIFTVAALGAHFSGIKGAYECSRAMHEFSRRQAAIMCENQNSNGRELWMAQTILLNHIGIMYGGERRSLEIAEFLQALPVTLGRRKRLFTNMFPMEKFAQLQLPRTQKWQIWLLDEERRRAGFAVWLIDSAFDAHFDLSRLMRLSELQISLPQPDDRWGASTAQSWASFPSMLENNGSGGLPTMERVVADDTWKSVWSKTNTLGKQVILQHLSDVIKDQSSSQFGVPGFSYHDKLLAANVLNELLTLTENEQIEQSIDEVKAATTHQIMALSALMTHNTPTANLLPTVVRCIYGKVDDTEWSQIGERWKSSSSQGRLGCFYAARILHGVRSSHCTHFGTPVSLLRAVLVLWLYSALSERSQEGFLYPRPAPAVVLGPKPLEGMDNNSWIGIGWSRVKLPGIGNLLCAEGRGKLLDDGVTLMKSLKGWGISSTYSQILMRLRASDASAFEKAR
ncbi:uncharacterized protein NECHADRAFT_87471 [Fusarium vanettenii 77-13-4]|uniref:Uncharacterized protein n=1 Tax=Fusarium vanettenii (strain ATCC MYA-4622 / CBS 123669 / FGSC 9596 / NRRL 45880 / 77-13-4) TaxID=660122 RepID=C7ZE77_FUSV7|nr:uncharacterized protein NECHADRAFT_87471 [Fusarium vanettenii 77-13-4]EEU37685.1 hypothetical protein NECHADRAFT_87471 [Fusarium vanettenii 77-13-4]